MNACDVCIIKVFFLLLRGFTVWSTASWSGKPMWPGAHMNVIWEKNSIRSLYKRVCGSGIDMQKQ